MHRDTHWIFSSRLATFGVQCSQLAKPFVPKEHKSDVAYIRKVKRFEALMMQWLK